MSELRETVYIGYDNAIRLALTEDDDALMTAYPTLSPSRWVLTIQHTTPITFDSATAASAFDWDSTDSILELYLGPEVTEEIGYTAATLVMYDATLFPNGLVLLHPSTTPDRLKIRIQDEE